MLVCLPDVMSHKRKATAHPKGILDAKRKHLNHDTTICMEHKASLALPLPPPRNGVHLSGPIRRQASLNAEIALQLLLDESPPNSPIRGLNRDVYLVSAGASFTPDEVPNPVLEPAVVHVTPEPTPEPEESHQSTVSPRTTALRTVHSTTPEDAVLDYGIVSDSPPASVASSDSDTKEVCVQQLRSSTPIARTKLKEPVISVVDCKKAVVPKSKKPATPTNTCKRIDFYVKRMASLNASACVTALIEPGRKYARQSHNRVLPKKATSDPHVEPKAESLQMKSESLQLKSENPQLKSESLETKSAHVHPLQSLKVEPCRNTDGTSVAIKSPPPEAYHSDAGMSVAPFTIGAVPDGASEDGAEAEIAPFNRLGLLYNGRTVHPETPVFLTSEGKLPARIIPTVVPPRATSLDLMEYAQNAKEQQKRKARKPRAQKGDNGWTCLGDPIKTIIRTEGDVKIERKYYVGIRRKNEEVFIRDSIVVKSGRRKQDKPYLAKIASIWEETGNLMMTLFWYYSPLDVEGINMADFQENEVLASQHHDDNGVACIEDKCYILGYRQYCRYQASLESKATSAASVVPGCVKGNSEGLHRPQENVHQSLVFLCYRGYNHISGKVCRGIK